MSFEKVLVTLMKAKAAKKGGVNMKKGSAKKVAVKAEAEPVKIEIRPGHSGTDKAIRAIIEAAARQRNWTRAKTIVKVAGLLEELVEAREESDIYMPLIARAKSLHGSSFPIDELPPIGGDDEQI